MKVDLSKKPFNLNEEEIKWVEETKNNMTIEEKIGQLFFLMGASENEMYLQGLLKHQPGGVMFRPLEKEKILSAHNFLQSNSKIPLFLAANLEAGSDGLIVEGNHPGNNMTIGATGDPEFAYKQGSISIREAYEVGGNMAFAPVTDLNYNFENPITNTRSYGDDVNKVVEMTKRFVDGVQDNGGSVTIKHFPGDGSDGRDQHLACTVNCLGLEDWKKTYGRIYQENIDNGATGMMVGHIALPSYFEENQITSEPSGVPASLSKVLLNDLVRDELGFNGLIMTDATGMVGFAQYGRRSDVVPMAIANGNDMFLFTKNNDEDYEFMMNGYKNGIISDERLDQALTRILGLKAAQKMYDNQNLFKSIEEDEIVANKQICEQIADNVITLVKDEQNLLPLSSEKKIGLIDFTNSLGDNLSPTIKLFKEELDSLGFEVDILKLDVGMEDFEKMIETMTMPVEEFKKLADVIIYVAQNGPASNRTSIRINYSSFLGFDAPWFVGDVPTMYISFGNPYHGYDWKDVKTGVNCYDNTPAIIKSAVDKLVTNNFKGESPVKLDYKPFTGKLD